MRSEGAEEEEMLDKTEVEIFLLLFLLLNPPPFFLRWAIDSFHFWRTAKGLEPEQA